MLQAAMEQGNEREERENVRAGTIAAAAMNAAGGKEGGAAWTWKDFFGEEEEPDPEVLRARMKAAMEAIKSRRRQAG